MLVRLSLAAAGAILALPACGGEGGSAGGTTTVSAAGFRQQVDAICQKYDQKLRALSPGSTDEEFVEFMNAAAPIEEAEQDELADLTPPEGIEDEWAGVMDLREQALRVERDLFAAVVANDKAKGQQLGAQLVSLVEDSDRLSRQMGISCSQATAAD
jgi:hypothetical protein